MSKPIISVNNLSKKYVLGERQPYYSFRDTVSGILHKPFHREKLEKDEFWALKDVSFEINQGDVVGVIGRNGAGKSTLLKILSQITPPTEGEIKLRGRIASLLEVGTGFHQELTGRENIYLNGAILGMKRWEINKKFEQIVEFAEIEKFLDTPVKHYSSGMYMRLAFSVAAHLEPEILLVDEVLAVGDFQFQKKCLGKMSEVSRGGRTILFVSHNISAISSLCTKGLLFENGKLAYFGGLSQTLKMYTDNKQNINTISNNNFLISNIKIKEPVIMGKKLEISFEITAKKEIKCQLGVEVIDSTSTNVFWLYPHNQEFIFFPKKTKRVVFSVQELNLYPGIYKIGFWLGKQGNREYFLHDQDSVSFEVTKNEHIDFYSGYSSSITKIFQPSNFFIDEN